MSSRERQWELLLVRIFIYVMRHMQMANSTRLHAWRAASQNVLPVITMVRAA
jgi:hypothetical protein